MSEEKQPEQPQPETQQQKPTEDLQGQVPEINFINYISSMVFQAMVFLGEIPNPLTNKDEKNLSQAKLLIDTIAMIRDKTKGNLSKQEEDFLSATLYELQMKFVQKSQSEVKT